MWNETKILASIPVTIVVLSPPSPGISEDEGVSEVVNVGDGIAESVILK